MDSLFDIIILAMIAGFILLRLRAELGKQSGDDHLPHHRGPLDGPRPGAPDPSGRYASAEEPVDAYGRPVEAENDHAVIDIEANPEVRQGLQAIRRADRSFDTHRFIEGARTAYGMILEAFWQADRDTLADFLSPEIAEQFNGAIDARERDGVTLDNRLLDIDDAKIIEAVLDGSSERITVEFEAEMVAVTRSAEGDIIDGNASDSVVSRDRWTFERDSRSRDPNWLVIATRPVD